MTLQIHPSFPSQLIDPRQVEIWLPPSYDPDPDGRYPVLYMHDGQNVFNPETSTHRIPWGVDEVMTRLIAEKKVREAIVVAVWCHSSKRWAEYMPQKALRYADPLKGAEFIHKVGSGLADHYVRFLVEELKPFIDTTYRTLPAQPDTFVMGSSMGGLISLYALCEYPDLFGGAGCLSTHWVAGDGVVLEYMKNNLPLPGQHKIYFDYGTIGLDAAYESFQMQADASLRAAGYQPGADWLTKKFPGAAHNEAAWRARVQLPLAFLLGNPR